MEREKVSETHRLIGTDYFLMGQQNHINIENAKLLLMLSSSIRFCRLCLLSISLLASPLFIHSFCTSER